MRVIISMFGVSQYHDERNCQDFNGRKLSMLHIRVDSYNWRGMGDIPSYFPSLSVIHVIYL